MNRNWATVGAFVETVIENIFGTPVGLCTAAPYINLIIPNHTMVLPRQAPVWPLQTVHCQDFRVWAGFKTKLVLVIITKFVFQHRFHLLVERLTRNMRFQTGWYKLLRVCIHEEFDVFLMFVSEIFKKKGLCHFPPSSKGRRAPDDGHVLGVPGKLLLLLLLGSFLFSLAMTTPFGTSYCRPRA
jgi:hypothetical protein